MKMMFHIRYIGRKEVNNGSPRHGHVADIMRHTHAKYHYIIRHERKGHGKSRGSKSFSTTLD